MGTPTPRLCRRIALLRNGLRDGQTMPRSGSCTALPRNRLGAGGLRTRAASKRLPAVYAGNLRAAADGDDATARAGAGRRRDPGRLAGGADGTRGHHRMVGRQSLAGAVGTCRSRAVHGSHPWAVRATAVAGGPRKATRGHEVGDQLRRRWPKDWPLQVVPRASWTQQRPTYGDAQPSIINAALDRSQRRPTGNWYVFAASRDVRTGRPLGARVAGTELVAWRDRFASIEGWSRQLPAPGCRSCHRHGFRWRLVLPMAWVGPGRQHMQVWVGAFAQLRRRRAGVGATRFRRRRSATG